MTVHSERSTNWSSASASLAYLTVQSNSVGPDSPGISMDQPVESREHDSLFSMVAVGVGMGVGVGGTGVGAGGTGVAVGKTGVGVAAGASVADVTAVAGASATDVAAGAVSCGPHPTTRRVTVTKAIIARNTFRLFIVSAPFFRRSWITDHVPLYSVYHTFAPLA